MPKTNEDNHNLKFDLDDIATTKEIQFDSDELNSFLADSPWATNREFGYQLMRLLKPKRMAELGSHYGCSLFAFAQAIKDFGLDTQIFAIDTWKGDEQAGFYGEEIIEGVKKIKAEQFPQQKIELMRMFFDDALPKIPDGSLDLIHIDGLHTYEAVKHDFETWLPKLKENGVMLMHDIGLTAQATGYGSAKFWQELAAKYPNFALMHSWGLGVLFPKGDEIFQKLQKGNIAEAIPYFEYKASYKKLADENHANKSLVEERYKIIMEMDKMIKERDNSLADKDKVMFSSQEEAMQIKGQLLEARDHLEKSIESISNLEKKLADQQQIINRNRHLIKLSNLIYKFLSFGKRNVKIILGRS